MVSAGVTYMPWYKEAWDAGGSLGAVTNYITGGGIQQTFNSNALAGPFGESQILRVATWKDPGDANRAYFGGTLQSPANVTLNNGDVTWIRIYHYFPSAFCAGTDSSSGDWDGSIKWFRYQFSSSVSARVTCKIDNISNGSCGSTATTPTIYGASAEAMATGTNNNYLATPVAIPRDQWVACQWKITHGQTLGSSAVEMWIDSTYCGAATILCSTFTSNSTEDIICVIGDYWNGGSAADNTWYISNAIFTKQTPNTLDSGGRPYIAPSTRISDFH